MYDRAEILTHIQISARFQKSNVSKSTGYGVRLASVGRVVASVRDLNLQTAWRACWIFHKNEATCPLAAHLSLFSLWTVRSLSPTDLAMMKCISSLFCPSLRKLVVLVRCRERRKMQPGFMTVQVPCVPIWYCQSDIFRRRKKCERSGFWCNPWEPHFTSGSETGICGCYFTKKIPKNESTFTSVLHVVADFEAKTSIWSCSHGVFKFCAPTNIATFSGTGRTMSPRTCCTKPSQIFSRN